MIDPEDDFAHWFRSPAYEPVEDEAYLTVCGRIRTFTAEAVDKPLCPTCADIFQRISEAP